jgi:hypothetical protein
MKGTGSKPVHTKEPSGSAHPGRLQIQSKSSTVLISVDELLNEQIYLLLHLSSDHHTIKWYGEIYFFEVWRLKSPTIISEIRQAFLGANSYINSS